MYMENENILALSVFSPFLLILLFPVVTALAVWPVKNLYAAFTGAVNNDQSKMVNPEYEKIIEFLEKNLYIGTLIGIITGVILFLHNIDKVSIELIHLVGRHAVFGIISVLSAAVIFTQCRGLFYNRNRHVKDNSSFNSAILMSVCRTYGITHREKEIIKMIADGLSNREICGNLQISDDTVKNHVYNIFKKTGVKNRNGLVGLLIEKGE